MQPIGNFTVPIDGRRVPILEAPLLAEQMGDDKEDPALREYAVRVEWIKTLPREKAVWEKGMYANQNSVTRMRSSFTLQRVTEAFALPDDASG